MFPSFLISFREVVEASLIVATILGILSQLDQKKSVKTVWLAVGLAGVASVVLLILAALLGLEVQEVYEGKVEEIVEGSFMVLSAVFVSWAVFFLHKYFVKSRAKILQRVKKSIEKEEQRGLFLLTFFAVFREGFEIVLFLSTIYLSSSPKNVLIGFTVGFVTAIMVSLGLFTLTSKMSFGYAFKMANILLILFAAGLLIRGVHEFTEVGILPETWEMSLAFVPPKTTFLGDTLKVVFGITRNINLIQIVVYSLYVLGMSWWVFWKKEKAVKIL